LSKFTRQGEPTTTKRLLSSSPQSTARIDDTGEA